MIRAICIIAALVTVLSAPAASQSEEAVVAVNAVIVRLFDAMRTGDTVALRSVFHPDARLMTTGTMPDGTPLLRAEPIDGFVRAVGGAPVELDERITHTEIRIDGRLAQAWTHYDFYAGGQFSHCGVNSFQFFLGSDGWQIIQLTDTRRREGCAPGG